MASMISRWYGALSVCQRPGAALLSADSIRYISAHWESVSSGGGFKADRHRANISAVCGASSTTHALFS